MKKLVFLITLILSNQPLLVFAKELAEPDIRLTSVVKFYADKQAFGNPTGIFFEPRKQEIYLADSGNHQIGIFDIKGTSLWIFKHWVTDSRTGERSLGNPQSVVVSIDGDIIVSDNRADYLDVFDYRGNLLQRIDPKDYTDMGPLRAASLAIDKKNNLYIATKTEKIEIIKLDSGYQFLMRFGKKGEEPQDFNNISGIWIDDDGNILVTDALASPVLKKFSPAGDYLGGYGGRTIEKVDFSLPSGVVTTAGGRVWIADQLRQVVKCLTAGGEFITMIGGLGYAPGDMYYPSAVASDGDSLLIVAEKNGNRYQQFIIK